MEIKNENFKALVQSCKEGDYIGQGNPDSKILIIGKEHSFAEEAEEQVKLENKRNWEQWEQWIQLPIDKLEKWYHPRYCYKHISTQFGEGQRFLIAPKNGGTSATWYAYQKLINTIYPDVAVKKNEVLNFFDHCFITELSTVPRKMSGKRNEDTQESIDHRLKDENGILRQNFFQSFPIIILACYHYIDMYDINVEQLFDQHFVKCIDLPKHEFINIHRNGNRLLLHTNHLCMRSNKFIEKVAKLCKEALL